MGATAEAINSALATPRPSAPHPITVTNRIDTGIVMASNLQVDDHACSPTGRLRARPAPMSDTMTHTSVR